MTTGALMLSENLSNDDVSERRPRASALPLDTPSASTRSARSHLAPEDAFKAALPPRRLTPGFDTTAMGDTNAAAELRRRLIPKVESRSRSRRRKRSWKKLLWVKQTCALVPLNSLS